MACAFDMSHCLTNKRNYSKIVSFFRHDKRLFQRKLMIDVKYRKKKFHKKKDFGCYHKIHLILRAKIKSSAWNSEQWFFPTLHRVT